MGVGGIGALFEVWYASGPILMAVLASEESYITENRVILDSMGLSIGSYDYSLVFLHHISIISFHLWCMPRGSV